MLDDLKNSLDGLLDGLPPRARQLLLLSSVETAETVERREVRYLVDDSSDLAAELANRGWPASSYRVQTIYLGVLDHHRIRLRRYDESDNWWLEKKRRLGDQTSKARWLLGPISMDAVRAIGVVRYNRVAFMTPTGRLTVDTDVTAGDGRRLQGHVVEAKGEDTLATILPTPDQRFSKFRFVSNLL